MNEKKCYRVIFAEYYYIDVMALDEGQAEEIALDHGGTDELYTRSETMSVDPSDWVRDAYDPDEEE